jgi:methionine-S-sulfoxide reductase
MQYHCYYRNKLKKNGYISQEELETAAFGMGCFWGPDALFGAYKGVVKTRVGYAGGTKDDPTYKRIGDHTETLLVEYNPEKIAYSKLLEHFWNNHSYNYNKKRGKNQYASRIFYTNKEQKNQAEASKAEKEAQQTVATEIHPLNFTVAEDYHQKYRLRHSKLMKNFSQMGPKKFRDSPVAAKLNGYVAGHLDLKDIETFNLDVKPGLKDRIVSSARKIV